MDASGLQDPLLIEPFRFGNIAWNVKITLPSTESYLRILLAITAAKGDLAKQALSSAIVK